MGGLNLFFVFGQEFIRVGAQDDRDALQLKCEPRVGAFVLVIFENVGADRIEFEGGQRVGKIDHFGRRFVRGARDEREIKQLAFVFEQPVDFWDLRRLGHLA